MWPNPQETADLVTFTEEILNGKLHFLCSASSILALLFFPYINDLRQGLLPDVSLFADKASLFLINNCGKASALALDSNLLKTQDWVYQWKMLLNKTKLNKYIILCFQERLLIFIHPPLLFNNATLKLTHAQSTCHSENMRTIKSVRQQKLESFFASYNLFYHADAYWTFINLSKYLNHGHKIS